MASSRHGCCYEFGGSVVKWFIFSPLSTTRTNHAFGPQICRRWETRNQDNCCKRQYSKRVPRRSPHCNDRQVQQGPHNRLSINRSLRSPLPLLPPRWAHPRATLKTMKELYHRRLIKLGMRGGEAWREGYWTRLKPSWSFLRNEKSRPRFSGNSERSRWRRIQCNCCVGDTCHPCSKERPRWTGVDTK